VANHALCWTCGKATNSGCSWSENLTPVKGWDAIAERGGVTVLRCPEYVRDSWGDGIYRDGEEYYRIIQKRLHKMEIARQKGGNG
jgi:hypothetical protein